MKAALCQTNIIWENKEENLKKAEGFTAIAAQNNADLIIFPEMSFTGFTTNTQLCGESYKKSPTVKFMQELSEKNKIAIAFGVIINESSKSYNRIVITNSNGEIAAFYDKIHPFTYSGEDKFFTGGNSITRTVIKDVTLSPFICYDLRFPQPFLAASQSAHLLIIIANWPESRISQWNYLLRGRAIENQAYVIGVNRTGTGNGIEYNGHSAAYDCYGNLLTEADSSECLTYCEIVPQTVAAYRKKFPAKADFRPKVYSSLK